MPIPGGGWAARATTTNSAPLLSRNATFSAVNGDYFGAPQSLANSTFRLSAEISQVIQSMRFPAVARFGSFVSIRLFARWGVRYEARSPIRARNRGRFHGLAEIPRAPRTPPDRPPGGNSGSPPCDILSAQRGAGRPGPEVTSGRCLRAADFQTKQARRPRGSRRPAAWDSRPRRGGVGIVKSRRLSMRRNSPSGRRIYGVGICSSLSDEGRLDSRHSSEVGHTHTVLLAKWRRPIQMEPPADIASIR